MKMIFALNLPDAFAFKDFAGFTTYEKIIAGITLLLIAVMTLVCFLCIVFVAHKIAKSILGPFVFVLYLVLFVFFMAAVTNAPHFIEQGKIMLNQ